MPKDSITQPGIVLSTNSLREADIVFTLLGKTSGKITVLARGAKSSKKRFMGGIQIFDVATYSTKTGSNQSNWYSLEAIRDRAPWSALLGSPRRYTLASNLLELTNEFTAEGDSEGGAVFLQLYKCLKALEKTNSQAAELSITCFYFLTVHRLSGFDSTELDLDNSLRVWFETMLSGQIPIVPNQEELLAKGLVHLLNYTEQVLGKKLRSSGEVRAISSR